MERASRYFSNGRTNQGVLNTLPAYVLGRVKGEALALHAARPENGWLLDQACVVIGYVEAFAFYREGEFPWGHVVERLERMRRLIARAERLAMNVNTEKIAAAQPKPDPKPKQPKPKPTVEDRCVRYDGRWVSRVWYARHVKQAA